MATTAETRTETQAEQDLRPGALPFLESISWFDRRHRELSPIDGLA
jgi:hypothetical protein